WRSSVERQVPSAQGPLTVGTVLRRESGKAHPIANQRSRTLKLGEGVRPIAHENGSSILKGAARLLFSRRVDRSGRGAAAEGGAQVHQSGYDLRGFQLKATVAPGRPAVAPNRLEDVANQSFVLPALPQITLEVRIRGSCLERVLLQLSVGARGIGHQVAPVIEQANIHVPRHGKDFSIDNAGFSRRPQ